MSKKKEKKELPIEETPEEVLEEQAGEAEAVEPEAEPQADTPGEEPETAPEETESPTQEQLIPKEQFLRLAAEYDNYRKRTAKEKESTYQDAKIDTISKFLEVYDNLERAVGQPGDEDNVHKKGMEMIFHQLVAVLEKMGVTILDPMGEAFDPERHEAVMHIDSEELGESVVSQVFQKGFLMGGKVVRFAKVQVAN